MTRALLFCSACAFFEVVSAAPASAGWALTDLGGWQGNGISAGQQVGATYVGSPHAALWSGTAASLVDLHPAGTMASRAYCVSGGHQVGYANVVIQPYPYTEEEDHAALWSGSAAWVDLNPSWAYRSYAYGVSGNQQVGCAIGSQGQHAGRWTGSAASWVDLNPAGSSESLAYGTTGAQQAGYATIGGIPHASLWAGTAVSWSDLSPAGCGSLAYGVSGGQQVGTTFLHPYAHASLWSGTAASWVDLNPAGAVSSEGRGVCGGLQVGYASLGGNDHAGLWRGTAASWVDLQALLPSGTYSNSRAYGIYTSGGDIWVVGCAYKTSFGGDKAMLWHYTVPEPPSALALLCPIWGLCGVAWRQRYGWRSFPVFRD